MSSETEKPELSINDRLAVERTSMANERTLLSYIRTSLALLAAGLTILKFFTSSGMHMLGYMLIPAGVGTLMVGLMNFYEVRSRLAQVLRR